MEDRLMFIEAGLAVLGKKYIRRGDKITAQCPAHEDRSPSFTATIGRDGGVLFHCFGGCSGAEILDALGTRWDQIKPDDYRAERKRLKPRLPDEDELIIHIAEADRKAGKRLQGRDLETYRNALLRQHGRGAA